MDFDHLTPGYKETQRARIGATATKIRERAEAIAAGRIVPDADDIPIHTGRRLTAAVMFLDIVEFSTLKNNTEAEQEAILRVLAYFFSEMFRIVSDYSGNVEKNTGDGLMAYFADGASDPPATGCHRAVSCAMTMMYTHKFILRDVISKSGIPPIDFRLTIDHGPITIARIGAAKLYNGLVAIGSTANASSKIQRLANGGEIVIGNDVRHNLPEAWKSWVEPIDAGTGFYYTATGEPYPAYRFTARWSGNGY